MINNDDVEVRSHLAEYIPQRLAELGMSEADLARATGDHQSQIHRVSRGQNTPSITFAMRLAKALKCDMNALCGSKELVDS